MGCEYAEIVASSVGLTPLVSEVYDSSPGYLPHRHDIVSL
jgi:hypothetical protein